MDMLTFYNDHPSPVSTQRLAGSYIWNEQLATRDRIDCESGAPKLIDTLQFSSFLVCLQLQDITLLLGLLQ